MAIVVGSVVIVLGLPFLFWRLMMPENDDQKFMGYLNADQKALAEQLESDVRYLSETIGERNMHRTGTMDITAAWIESRFGEIGFDRIDRQTYTLQRSVYHGREADNLIAEVAGIKDTKKVLVVGAHYDTVPNSSGANDNSSAVAALLALARHFMDQPADITLRFVAFANEEPPFFRTSDMGSYAYAKSLKNQNEYIIAMLSMDGLGYFSDEPGSQHYPLPGIGLLYPDTANFIAFVTRFKDYRLMNKALKAFRNSADIPAEGVALPGFIPGVTWSDHWSFWRHGFPAFLVTDTLPFRDPNYHTPRDTPDKLDFERMALVVEGLAGAIRHLGENK